MDVMWLEIMRYLITLLYLIVNIDELIAFVLLDDDSMISVKLIYGWVK